MDYASWNFPHLYAFSLQCPSSTATSEIFLIRLYQSVLLRRLVAGHLLLSFYSCYQRDWRVFDCVYSPIFVPLISPLQYRCTYKAGSKKHSITAKLSRVVAFYGALM